MIGWNGAKYLSAPLTPSAATTTLLQIGQPMARYAAGPAIVTRPAPGSPLIPGSTSFGGRT